MKERWSKKGIGSPRLLIEEASINIHINEVSDINYCSIELRPYGILVNITQQLNLFSLVIPYYKLKLYKGKAQQYSIYNDKN